MPLAAQTPKGQELADPVPEPGPKQATLVKNPKPLVKQTRAGLEFLIKQQLADGSWSGGPTATLFEGLGIGGGIGIRGKPKAGTIDVANTSVAALAILRAGYTPQKGPYAENLRRALNAVLKAVEASDNRTLALETTKGTQVQMKIGDHVDTFLAAMLLATVKNATGDAKTEDRLEKALQKIVEKMELNQKDNGTWQGEGWAPVLSQALASRAINLAKQNGAAVDADKLEKTAQHARESFKQFSAQGGKGGFVGAAGVDLYGAAAAISALQDAVNTNRAISVQSQSVLRSPKADAKDLEMAKRQLARLDEHEKALRDALKVMARKSQDPNFVRGFGSDGGEEFISFTLISEAMLANQMKEFSDWDRALGGRLVNAQNGNGSWSGMHCISGETFCTATALMTMMADRAQRPVGSELVARTEVKLPVPSPKDLTRNDPPPTAKPVETATATEAEKVLHDLLNGEGDRTLLFAKLRDTKGGEYTDSLAHAATKLRGDLQVEAREALVARLTRMTVDTLRKMLLDDDREVRRAAALAGAKKGDRSLVPDLILILSDGDPLLPAAGRAALKTLTGQDFGPAADASAGERTKSILAWKNWWSQQLK